MNLPRIITRSKKRPGRGYGSGRGGHTSGRGQKGQKSRGKIGVLFEGVKMKKSFLKRLPLARGKGKFHAKKTRGQKYESFKSAKTSKKAAKSSK